MEKIYSELTKQYYYSEEAKKADEKVYKEQLAEKEKREQALKETREARVKEFDEAVNKLAELRKEYNKKFEEKYEELNKELEDYSKELKEEYLSKKSEIQKVIDNFNKDYPNGVFITYRNGKANTALEKVINNFFNEPFFRDPLSSFNSFVVNPQKRIR